MVINYIPSSGLSSKKLATNCWNFWCFYLLIYETFISERLRIEIHFYSSFQIDIATVVESKGDIGDEFIVKRV